MDMTSFGIASVAAITVICYLIGLIVKATPFNNDKYIPIACGVVGGVLSVVGIAMNMKAIFKGDAVPFFFIGFLMVVYFSLNMLSLSCFALLFASVYANLKEGGLAAPAIAEGDDDDE